MHIDNAILTDKLETLTLMKQEKQIQRQIISKQIYIALYYKDLKLFFKYIFICLRSKNVDISFYSKRVNKLSRQSLIFLSIRVKKNKIKFILFFSQVFYPIILKQRNELIFEVSLITGILEIQLYFFSYIFMFI